jgi:hypothetical protein
MSACIITSDKPQISFVKVTVKSLINRTDDFSFKTSADINPLALKNEIADHIGYPSDDFWIATLFNHVTHENVNLPKSYLVWSEDNRYVEFPIIIGLHSILGPYEDPFEDPPQTVEYYRPPFIPYNVFELSNTDGLTFIFQDRTLCTELSRGISLRSEITGLCNRKGIFLFEPFHIISPKEELFIEDCTFLSLLLKEKQQKPIIFLANSVLTRPHLISSSSSSFPLLSHSPSSSSFSSSSSPTPPIETMTHVSGSLLSNQQETHVKVPFIYSWTKEIQSIDVPLSISGLDLAKKIDETIEPERSRGMILYVIILDLPEAHPSVRDNGIRQMGTQTPLSFYWKAWPTHAEDPKTKQPLTVSLLKVPIIQRLLY